MGALSPSQGPASIKYYLAQKRFRLQITFLQGVGVPATREPPIPTLQHSQRRSYSCIRHPADAGGDITQRKMEKSASGQTLSWRMDNLSCHSSLPVQKLNPSSPRINVASHPVSLLNTALQAACMGPWKGGPSNKSFCMPLASLCLHVPRVK